jgi:hypothetical protein
VGFYTGEAIPTNGIPDLALGIYTNAVFGWGKFVTRDDRIELLDSALEYGGAGIYAGTQTIIPPEFPLLNFTNSGNQQRLWWPLSAGEFMLQETSDLARASWADATSPLMLNLANLHYEMNLQLSTGGMFYRLRSK